MTEHALIVSEIKGLIGKIGDSLGYDHTSEPVFAKGRDDIAVVQRTTENGSSYGYDTVYVIWKDRHGTMRHHNLIDTKTSKDYLQIKDTPVFEDDALKVTVTSGGSMSGRGPWEKNVSVELPEAQS